MLCARVMRGMNSIAKVDAAVRIAKSAPHINGACRTAAGHGQAALSA
jgi:hypothetical protein